MVKTYLFITQHNQIYTCFNSGKLTLYFNTKYLIEGTGLFNNCSVLFFQLCLYTSVDEFKALEINNRYSCSCILNLVLYSGQIEPLARWQQSDDCGIKSKPRTIIFDCHC